MSRLKIVVPIFNDWQSFLMLVRDLDHACAETCREISVLAIDDGSTDEPPENLTSIEPVSVLSNIEIVRLAMNLGHTRAIAIGMALASEASNIDAIVVMDGDGEDRPLDIRHLLNAVEGQRDFIAVAERRKRSESFSFRLFYHFYKFTFALLTGRKISFGNFSITSPSYARRLAMLPDLWNNFPAALIRSRLPIHRVPTDRGRRYAGTSKMNYVSLMVLGLSGVSIYSDAIMVRMLVATGALLVAGVVAISTVLIMRLFTNLATPGWATTVAFGTMIIVCQAVFSTLTSLLLLLNGRSQRLIVPALDHNRFIHSRKVIAFAPTSPVLPHI